MVSIFNVLSILSIIEVIVMYKDTYKYSLGAISSFVC